MSPVPKSKSPVPPCEVPVPPCEVPVQLCEVPVQLCEVPVPKYIGLLFAQIISNFQIPLQVAR